MKRFKTQPSEFFALDYDMRMEIYFREFDLVKEEAADADRMRAESEAIKNKTK